MKKLHLFIVVLLVRITASAKGYFYINSVFMPVEISLNNITYTIDSNYSKLPTRYPRFDTLQILDGSWRSDTKIICNFKPDSSYSFFMNCCAMTDIVATWRFKLLQPMDNDIAESDDATNHELMNKPQFTFRIKKPVKNDSIYAWYQDHSCFPSFRLIDKKGWDYGVPHKCYYWSNISPITFFRTTGDYSKFTDEYGVVNDVFPEEEGAFESLGTIYVRIFDEHQYIVTYNCRNKKITLNKVRRFLPSQE